MPIFGFGIRYLNGWAMAAADGAKRECAEWPPHPDRTFMALAAAWFETDQDADEGAALRWLETLPRPGIKASDFTTRTTSGRDAPVVSYVPVNDTQCGSKAPDSNELGKLKDAGLALLPEFRSRQAKSYPLAIPYEQTAYLVWADNLESGKHHEALARLARKVTHIGHSASFVQMWFEPEPPPPDWVAVDGVAKHRLRVFGPGRLDDLETRANVTAVRAHAELVSRMEAAEGKAKKALQAEMTERFGDHAPASRRPEAGLWAGYDRPRPPALAPCPCSVFDPNFVVLSLTGRRLSLPAALKLTEALRGAVQSVCPEPIPEWVSGHAPNGESSRNSHLAFVPLPFVGSAHADGRLLGVGLVLPREISAHESTRCLQQLLYEKSGLARAVRLFNGQWLECLASLEQRESPPLNLQPRSWTGPAKVWASVTPVGLDRHFDGADKWVRAAESLKDGCVRIGLPRPREALMHPVSMIEGVPHSRDFPHLRRKSDGGCIHHAHAVLVFEEIVEGPVLIGAGRYRGYGFFRPLRETVSANS